MPDSKISALAELTLPDAADEFVVVDKSDLTMSATGTDKRITYGNLPGLYAAYINIREEQAAGVDGGTFTSGGWRTRVLNTEHADTGNDATLSSNQITLQAGTYQCSIRCPAGYVGTHQTRLYNITDATTELVGSTAYVTSADTGVTQTDSWIVGRFTIASAKVFEVQHICQVTRATDGFGLSQLTAQTEIYTMAEFWKER